MLVVLGCAVGKVTEEVGTVMPPARGVFDSG